MNIKFIILFSAFIYLCIIFLYSIHTYKIEKKVLLQTIDEKLLIGVRSIEKIISESYHDRALTKYSIPNTEYNSLLKKMSEFTWSTGFEYAYSIILRNDSLFLTSSNASKEEWQKQELVSYFEYYYDAPAELYQCFKSNKICFYNYQDQWGEVRSVWLPCISPLGKTYVIGIDYKIEFINNLIWQKIKRSILIAFILLLASLPLFLSLFYSNFIHNKELKKINNQLNEEIIKRKTRETELENYKANLEQIVTERTKELAVSNEELLTTNEELTSANEELYKQREVLETMLVELNKTQNHLIQSEKMASLGIIAAGIAHEINNPLNFIRAGLEGVKSYIQDNVSEKKDDLTTLMNGMNIGIERASEIVKSLNHYSRKDEILTEKYNIHNIIDNCLIMLQNEVKNKIIIVKNYHSNPLIFRCNESKLHQAFLNIILNAIQSIGKKGQITISTFIENSYYLIHISDTGCGISKENLPKITDLFFTTKEPGKGTGLGLSITYKIIKDHNGILEFDSTLEKGTKVIIKFPINI